MWVGGTIVTIVFGLWGAESLLGRLSVDGIDRAAHGFDQARDTGISTFNRSGWRWGLGSLGGQDCADDDATVTPGRLDLPNDGIDQNCWF